MQFSICTIVFLVKKEVGNQNFRSISLKLTELWHLMSYMGARPYMGARTKLDLLNAPDWPNCNIFWWNLFYMINRHKLHIIIELELFIYQNIDLRAKKPQYFKGGGGSTCFFLGKMIFEIWVGRNSPPIGGTFGEVSGPLRQMGYAPRPCPYMATKIGHI